MVNQSGKKSFVDKIKQLSQAFQNIELLNLFKGSDRLCMVVELSRQYCGQILKIFCRRYLIINKKILKTYPPKKMILKVDFAIKLSDYTS